MRDDDHALRAPGHVDVARGVADHPTPRQVQRELPRLQRAAPASVTLEVVHDRTHTIRASVNDVQFTLVLAVGLVATVVIPSAAQIGAGGVIVVVSPSGTGFIHISRIRLP